MESRNNFLHVLLRYLRSHHAFLGRFYLESSWLLIVHELHEAGCGKYKVIRGYSATAISLSRDSCHISHISTDPQEIMEPLAFGLLWLAGCRVRAARDQCSAPTQKTFGGTEKLRELQHFGHRPWADTPNVEFTQCHRAKIWGWFRPPNMLTWGWFIGLSLTILIVVFSALSTSAARLKADGLPRGMLEFSVNSPTIHFRRHFLLELCQGGTWLAWNHGLLTMGLGYYMILHATSCYKIQNLRFFGHIIRGIHLRSPDFYPLESSQNPRISLLPTAIFQLEISSHRLGGPHSLGIPKKLGPHLPGAEGLARPAALARRFFFHSLRRCSITWKAQSEEGRGGAFSVMWTLVNHRNEQYITGEKKVYIYIILYIYYIYIYIIIYILYIILYYIILYIYILYIYYVYIYIYHKHP